MSRKMAAICMSTARALVKPTASSVGLMQSNAVRSAVRAPVAVVATMMPSFRNGAARGIVGIAAAPALSGSLAQRANFHVSAYDSDAAAEGGEAAAPAEGPVKLYVGNLSWGVGDDELEGIFEGFQASDMTVVSDMNTGRSRGFGFVTVPNAEEAEKAIAALDGSEVDGRPIRVNISVARGSDRPAFGDRPPRERSERNYDFDARKIYFGNLSWGMDHLDLSDLCSEFGNVEDSRLITDRETGRSRGFGFVTMGSADEAEAVVQGLNGQDVDGRVLRVNIANVDK